MGFLHWFSNHIVEIVQGLTFLALIWYASETRLSRKEDERFHRSERRVDYYFLVKRHEEPSKTDLLRFAEYPKPRQADAVATVANLGKLALLLEGIVIQCRSSSPREYPIPPVALTTGISIEFIIADLIVRYLHEIGLINDSTPPERRSWTGELDISLRFYSRGISRISEPQRYAVGITSDAVQTIHFIRDNVEDNSPRLTKSALSRA